jgi:hypothetical protein
VISEAPVNETPKPDFGRTYVMKEGIEADGDMKTYMVLGTSQICLSPMALLDVKGV